MRRRSIIVILLLLGVGFVAGFLGMRHCSTDLGGSADQLQKPQTQLEEVGFPKTSTSTDEDATSRTSSTDPASPGTFTDETSSWATLGAWNPPSSSQEFQIWVLKDGAPAKGVEVVAGVAGLYPPEEVTTNDEGKATIRTIPNTRIEAYARGPGGAVWRPLAAQEMASQGATLHLTKGVALRVKVLDSNGLPAPLEAIVVTKEEPVALVTRRTHGNTKGIAVIKDLPEGRYWLQIYPVGSPAEYREVHIKANEINTIDATLEVIHQLTATFRVQGEVVAEGTSATTSDLSPIAGAYVALYSRSSRGALGNLGKGEGNPLPSAVVVTDREGKFTADGIPAGEFWAIVLADGFATTRTSTRPLQQSLEGFRITVRRSIKQPVEVVDRAGKPVVGAEVVVLESRGSGERVVSRGQSNHDGIVLVDRPATLTPTTRTWFLLQARLGEWESDRVRFPFNKESSSSSDANPSKAVRLTLVQHSDRLRFRIEPLVEEESLTVVLEVGHQVCSLKLVNSETFPKSAEPMVKEESTGRRGVLYDAYGCKEGPATLTVRSENRGSIRIPLKRIDGTTVTLPEFVPFQVHVTLQVTRSNLLKQNENDQALIEPSVINVPTLVIRGKEISGRIHMEQLGGNPQDGWIFKGEAYPGVYHLEGTHKGYQSQHREVRLRGDSPPQKPLPLVLSPLKSFWVWVVDRRESPVSGAMVRLQEGQKGGREKVLILKENPVEIKEIGVPKEKRGIRLVGYEPRYGAGEMWVLGTEEEGGNGTRGSQAIGSKERPYVLRLNSSIGSKGYGLPVETLSKVGIRGVPHDYGYLLEVEPGSLGARAGIRQGDHLVEVQRKGTELRITIHRDGTYQTFSVKSGEP